MIAMITKLQQRYINDKKKTVADDSARKGDRALTFAITEIE